jgi:hypothetical protein
MKPMKNSNETIDIEPATFQPVAQCLDQLHHKTLKALLKIHIGATYFYYP